jgi:hypothetical protein
MKINKGNTIKAFKQAVENTNDIKYSYQVGLKGLGANSAKIKLTDNRKCEGSVDIDTSTLQKYPQANRWDYLFSYEGKVYFVEVHSAKTDDVSVVLKKLNWLKEWLNTEAPEIKKLKANQPYFWIQSNKFDIPKTSKQYRIIAQNGLKPIRILSLR